MDSYLHGYIQNRIYDNTENAIDWLALASICAQVDVTRNMGST